MVMEQPRYEVIKFGVDWDVSGYRDFVKFLRNSLTYRVSANDFGLLKPEQQSSGVRPEDFWQDVQLVASEQTIFLRFDPTNLYLIGYRGANDTVWWEFKPSNNGRRMIMGSKILGFSGGYGDLPGGSDRLNVVIGQQQMLQAVFELATTDPKQNPTIAGSHLLVLILMISEAARIRKICVHIEDTWGRESTKIDETMHQLTNSWGQLSLAIRELDAKGVSSPPDTPLGTGAGIITLGYARSALGILKCDKVLPSDEDPYPTTIPRQQGRVWRSIKTWIACGYNWEH